MRRLRLVQLLAAVCLGAIALPGAASAASIYNAKTFTLANGLQVVVIEDHRAPVVTHMVWYKVGAADDPVGKSGIAHFLEHLMFKGTPSVPANEFNRIIARNGGTDNAFTTLDYTGFYEDVAAPKLDLAMRLEADRMQNLTIGENEVTTERQVIIEERRSRIDNEPGALFAEQLQAAQYLASPYRIPVIGWRHEMEGLTRADALSYYKAHYAPNNAIVVIVGDVSLDRVRSLAEKYYGVVPRRDVPPRLRPQEPPQIAARRVTMGDPRVRQASWTRSYLAPSSRAGDTKLAIPLMLLADILGGGETSRLHRALVLGDGIATSAGAGYDALSLDLSTFDVFARPKQGVPLEKIEAGVDGAIADLLKGGITADELARAKTGYRAGAIYGRDSNDATARLFGSALVIGLDVESVVSFVDRVDATTAEQVENAARAVFDLRHSVTGTLSPKPAS